MTPHWVWLTFITILGANVGSFLNVVVYRLPAGISLVTPPSRCPHCEHQLSMWRLENVPILGWLWLRGKCRKCKATISVQYPLVELLTAVLFGGSYFLFYMLDGGVIAAAGYADGWREPMGTTNYAFTQTFPIFMVWLVMIACLIAATLIDAKLYIIPLGITWVIAITGFVVLPLATYLEMPTWGAGAKLIRYEPFVPLVKQTGAMVAWGGAIGLIIAIALLRLGVLPDSFEGEDDDEALDENGELPPLKHPRRVALKELMFVGFPLLGMLAGHFVVSRDLIAQPDLASHGWYYVLAGCTLGYLVGGGVIWACRILGTLAFNKEAMGLGDVHLLGAIGVVLGWHEVVFLAIFIAPILAILVTAALAIAASLKNGVARVIPYGPYLAGAALIVLLLGVERVDFLGIYDTLAGRPDSGIPPLFVP
jgi:leader peptidase (prepilin peptidase)/N-methyltransferase